VATNSRLPDQRRGRDYSDNTMTNSVDMAWHTEQLL